MFNNLIESSSHGREFRRRGSFLLFTTLSYALLFVIAGVISIYAYDARMDDQNPELVTLMPLVDLPAPEPPRVPVPTTSPISSTAADNDRNDFQREVAFLIHCEQSVNLINTTLAIECLDIGAT